MSVPNGILYQPLGTDDTTVVVLGTNLAPSSPGVITIDSEDIHYQGCDSTSFFSCTRGYNSTTAATHAQGAAVVFSESDAPGGPTAVGANSGDVPTADGDGQSVWEAGGGGGGGTWGSITGTLSDQTDLQAALDDKASLGGATFTGNIIIDGGTPSLNLNSADNSQTFCSFQYDGNSINLDASNVHDTGIKFFVDDGSLHSYVFNANGELDLPGDVVFTATGSVIRPNSDGVNVIDFTAADGTTSLISLDTNSRHVGIGTKNPSELLDVNGDMKCSGTLTVGSILNLPALSQAIIDTLTPNGAWMLKNTDTNKLQWWNGSAWETITSV